MKSNEANPWIIVWNINSKRHKWSNLNANQGKMRKYRTTVNSKKIETFSVPYLPQKKQQQKKNQYIRVSNKQTAGIESCNEGKSNIKSDTKIYNGCRKSMNFLFVLVYFLRKFENETNPFDDFSRRMIFYWLTFIPL